VARLRDTFPSRRVFLTAWLIFTVHWGPYMIREHLPAVAIATRGTLDVSPFLGWTDDVFPGPRGGAFINNNPGASLVGAIPLVAARPLLDRIERWNDQSPASIARSAHAERYSAKALVEHRREWYFLAVAFLTCAGLMAPLSALAVTLFGVTLWRRGVDRRKALAAAAIFGFATPIFLRTTYLNHNLLVAHAGLGAMLMLYAPRRAPLSFARTLTAGALAGFAILCDYSGVVLAAALGVYVWLRAGDGDQRGLRRRLRMGMVFCAGAAPFLLGLFAYQRWAFGFSTLPSQQFMPAIAETSRGYRGMDWPSLELLWMNFFNPGFGLFAVCPLLALGLVAPFVRARGSSLPAREVWTILGFFVGMALFCAANQYSRLQYLTGLRYLVPVVPGLLLLSLPLLERLPAGLAWSVVGLNALIAWTSVNETTVAAWLRRPWELQLAWLRRAAEYDAVARPGAWTAVVLLGLTVVVALLWRREPAQDA
jgi:hypothetical protein